MSAYRRHWDGSRNKQRKLAGQFKASFGGISLTMEDDGSLRWDSRRRDQAEERTLGETKGRFSTERRIGILKECVMATMVVPRMVDLGLGRKMKTMPRRIQIPPFSCCARPVLDSWSLSSNISAVNSQHSNAAKFLCDLDMRNSSFFVTGMLTTQSVGAIQKTDQYNRRYDSSPSPPFEIQLRHPYDKAQFLAVHESSRNQTRT
jgi:hypothetical protein